MCFGGEFLLGVNSGIGGCVFDSPLDDLARHRLRLEHVPRERRVGIRDGEANGVHRGEILACLLESRLISGVARSRMGSGMTRRLGEVDQTGPHQTVEICDPERNRSARKTGDCTVMRRNIHRPAIDDLFACLGDGEKSSRDGLQELGTNPVHLVHDAGSRTRAFAPGSS